MQYNGKIQHYLNFEFPDIPHLWNYDDFGNIGTVCEITKTSMLKIRKFIFKNDMLRKDTVDMNDANTNVYILAQSGIIDGDQDLYLSAHTFMFKTETGKDKIEYEDNSFLDNPENSPNYKFRFQTGQYPIDGEIEIDPNNSKAIPVNKLEMRKCSIHKYNGIITFSPKSACNFKIQNDKACFVSIVKPINTGNKTRRAKNCIVVHIYSRSLEDFGEYIDNMKKN